MNAFDSKSTKELSLMPDVERLVRKGKGYSCLIGNLRATNWYPPLSLTEEEARQVRSALDQYETIFEILSREQLIEGLVKHQDMFEFKKLSSEDADRVIKESVRTLEPISSVLLRSVLKRCREHSRYYPEEWMLERERQSVMEKIPATYLRLLVLWSVGESPSPEDTISEGWYRLIHLDATRMWTSKVQLLKKQT